MKTEVSVIIPTWKRYPLLVRALNSIFNQTFKNFEVIVVVDGPDHATIESLNELNDPRLKVIERRANSKFESARNLGVREAKSNWIAFIDDDDEWLPNKLEKQLSIVEQSSIPYPICTCRLIGRTEANDFIWPRRFPNPKEHLSEYLLCRKKMIWGEGLLQTSTLLTSKDLLLKVPFDHTAGFHDDIDWILRASRVDGVKILFLPDVEPFVIWHIEENRPRISNRVDWKKSFAWIKKNKRFVTRRAYASFILTWISTFASKSGDWKAIFPLLHEAWQNGQPSFIDLLVFVGNWVLPKFIQRQIAVIYSAHNIS
jgi:glycosyltransferase involved in cell wall biosynthesis